MIDDNIYLSNISVISYLGHFLKKTMKVKKGTMNNTLSNMRTETQTHSALQEISYLITTTAAQLEQRPAMLQEFPSIVYCLSQCCSSFWWIFKLNKGWEKEYGSGINGLFPHYHTPKMGFWTFTNWFGRINVTSHLIYNPVCMWVWLI